jgi:hypothetical protein
VKLLLVSLVIAAVVVRRWLEMAAEAMWRAALVQLRPHKAARWLREVLVSRAALAALLAARFFAPAGSEVARSVAAIWGDHVQKSRKLKRDELAVLAPLAMWNVRLACRALAAWTVMVVPTVNAALASVAFGFYAAFILTWTALPAHIRTAIAGPASWIAVAPELLILLYGVTPATGIVLRMSPARHFRWRKLVLNFPPTSDITRLVGILVLTCAIAALMGRIMYYPFEIPPYAGLFLLVVASSAKPLGGRLAVAATAFGATVGTPSVLLLVAGQIAAAIATATLALLAVAGVSARRIRTHGLHAKTQVAPHSRSA